MKKVFIKNLTINPQIINLILNLKNYKMINLDRNISINKSILNKNNQN